MPSPRARALTAQHRRELVALAAPLTARIRRTALQASLGDIDGWWKRILDQILSLVGLGWRRARDLSADYLVEHARIEGVDLEPVLATWNTDRAETSLRVRGPVLFKQHVERTGEPDAARATMARTLPAAAQRLVLAGDRDTVRETAEESREIVGWRRVTDEDPCYWCAMLASRGAVYLSAESAKGVVGRRGVPRGNRLLGESYHDNDECTVEPLYEDEDEPPEVEALYQEWLDATEGAGGKAAIRKWRAYWDAKKKG